MSACQAAGQTDRLRLETSMPSPCTGTSRWVSLHVPCGAEETNLDTETKATLSQAIRSSADATNDVVRDAVASSVDGGVCHDGGDQAVAGVETEGDASRDK